ncbi:MAG: hypothetical protein WB689_31965, partial [Xanthobacteraceae bacterium]
MSARIAATTVEKSPPVESSIEAEINSLIEEQTPKRIQIEDDAERSRSFVARMTSNSIDEGCLRQGSVVRPVTWPVHAACTPGLYT